MINTYAFLIVNLANPTQGLGSTYDSNCLDGHLVAKAGTLAVDNTWDVYVCADAVLFAGFDDFVVGTYGLRD